MSQSLARNIIHLIFSTKQHRPWLDEDIQPRMFAYIAGITQEWESPVIAIGGHKDHVHAIFVLGKNYALSKVVEECKKRSSKWIKTRGRK